MVKKFKASGGPKIRTSTRLPNANDTGLSGLVGEPDTNSTSDTGSEVLNVSVLPIVGKTVSSTANKVVDKIVEGTINKISTNSPVKNQLIKSIKEGKPITVNGQKMIQSGANYVPSLNPRIRTGVFGRGKGGPEAQIDKTKVSDTGVELVQASRKTIAKAKTAGAVAKTIGTIATGKYVNEMLKKSMQGNMTYSSFYASKSKMDKSTTNTSIEAVKGVRSGITNAKNVGVGVKNTITGIKKSYSIGKRLYTSVKSAVKNTRNTLKTIRNARTIAERAKLVAKTTQRAIRSMINMIRALSNPLVWKAGHIVVDLFLVIYLITSAGGLVSTIVNSVNSIFMANETTLSAYKAELERLDADFKSKIDQLSIQAGYDTHSVIYMNDEGVLKTNWNELLAMTAVKFNQELTFSNDEKQYLTALFNAMNRVVTRTEEYQEPVSNTTTNASGTSVTTTVVENRTKLVVEVYNYGFDDVIDTLGFTKEQKEWAIRIETNGLSALFPGVAGLTSESLTPAEIQALLASSPTTTVTREKIVSTALSLVGKVGYFWGGRSTAGWNNLWGTPQLVTAEGSTHTGEYQPYGLDCAGFIDWVYKTAGVGSMFSDGGTTYQWEASYPISEAALLPGDLVFKQTPSASGINHVGIYVGCDLSGNKLFVHCAGGSGVVVNGYEGFKYWRRPFVKGL